MRYALLFFSAFLFQSLLSAQPLQSATMDVGRIRVHIQPNGAWGNEQQPFMEWQKEDGSYVSLLSTGGLHYGGIAPGGEINLSVLDGRSNAAGRAEPGFEVIGIFKVTKAQIVAHLDDYWDNQIIDNPIDAIYSWPAEGNPFFTEYTGLSLPSGSNPELAGYWEFNSTGAYDPSQGDSPFLPFPTNFGGPLAIPTEMYQLIYRQIPSGLLFNTQPIIYSTVVATFACPSAPVNDFINRTVFIYTKTIYQGLENQFNVHLGYHLNSAIGDPTDDAMGSDSLLQLSYFYSSNETDTQFGEEAVPAVGIYALRGPLDANGFETRQFSSMPLYAAPSGAPETDPAITRAEVFNRINARWNDGDLLEFGGNGYDTGNPTTWAFTGDVDDDTSWTYADVVNPPPGIGVVSSFDEITYVPGAINGIVLAITVSDRGQTIADRVDSLKSISHDIFSLLSLEETCDSFPSSSSFLERGNDELVAPINIYPNPATALLRIELSEQITIRQIRVHNLTGQELLRRKGADRQLDISSLSPGLFFITVETDAGRKTLRFVKE